MSALIIESLCHSSTRSESAGPPKAARRVNDLASGAQRCLVCEKAGQWIQPSEANGLVRVAANAATLAAIEGSTGYDGSDEAGNQLAAERAGGS